jgi:hypothetical protein
VSAAASILPSPPSTPQVDWAQSGNTSLYISWTASSTGTLPESPILGYKLEMDSGNATFVEVYDGSYHPGILGQLIANLTNGHYYTFRVIALNYNGASQPSATASYYVCTAPTSFPAPVVESQTSSSMTLSWVPPSDLGGCRVTGYAVWRDDGAVASASAGTGITTELNSASDPLVRGRPSLNTLVATNFPANTAGQAFRL